MNIITNKRQELLDQINEVVTNEIDLLKKESEFIQVNKKKKAKQISYDLFNFIEKKY